MINIHSPPDRCLTTEALKIGLSQPAMWMGDLSETEEDRAVAVLRSYGASVTEDSAPGSRHKVLF